MRLRPVAPGLLLLLLAACSTARERPRGWGIGPEPVAATGAALDLVGVWVIDVPRTVQRVEKASAGERQRLERTLRRIGTELALNPDGNFILKNRQPDARGTWTVQGVWRLSNTHLELTGVIVDGRPAEPYRTVVYRLDQGLLVGESPGEGTVRPVLKCVLRPRR